VITEADIASAERLLGIVYTARERAQMVGNLDGQIASATARRKVRLANSMPIRACRRSACRHSLDRCVSGDP
jgi:hypothetical protein